MLNEDLFFSEYIQMVRDRERYMCVCVVYTNVDKYKYTVYSIRLHFISAEANTSAKHQKPKVPENMTQS